MKSALKNISTILCFVLPVWSMAQDKYLETIKVTDSIYVFQPKIEWTHGNGVAIIGNDGVFFIDTYIQTNYAEEAIRRLKKITKQPVRYVLNTHWHYDHVMGNDVFRKAYPGSKLIMHDSTVRFMNSSVKRFIEQEPGRIKTDITQLERELKARKMDNGYTITETMAPFWEWQIREAKEYDHDYKGNKLVPVDITFNDSLNFYWGSQTIQLIHGSDNGHSSGDVIVWIPEKKLVITGDIIVSPTPYATYFNIPGMIRSIQRIIDMNPAIIIPGHGAVQYNLSYVQLLKQAFTAYMNEAEKAIEQKLTLKEAYTSISVPEIDRQFTGDDDVKKWAYKAFFSLNLIRNMYKIKGKTG